MTTLFKTTIQIVIDEKFPKMSKGRPRIMDSSEALECIFHLVKTGIQWRHVKSQYVSHITVFKAMHKWMQHNVFSEAYKRLLKLYSRRRKPRYLCVDSSFVKNVYGNGCTGQNPTDRGRQATKLSVVVDDMGVAHSLRCDPANIADVTLLPKILDSMMTTIRGVELFADKGYDSRRNRMLCVHHKLRDRIFKRKTTCSKRTHAKRGVVERFFSWHDKQRRLIVRYEKYVTVYMQMTFLFCGTILERRL